MFTVISLLFVGDDMDRILANIVTGIGFIGGGVIFKSEDGINGLTTAATIWITAAVGMAVGAGYYTAAGFGIAATFLILSVFYHIEEYIDHINKERTYTIIAPLDLEKLYDYEEAIRSHHLKFKQLKKTRLGEKISGTYKIRGTKKNHQLFIEYMLKDKEVLEFNF
jgi:putative Mg2+ transporter-C (MgtC) family protein